MLLKLFIAFISLQFFLFGKSTLSFSLGGYSLSTKVQNRSQNYSGVGNYHFEIKHLFYKNVSANLGYTLIYDSVITGDSMYGIDFGASWYPLASTIYDSVSGQNITLGYSNRWAPYIGFQFNQRQFQSNKSNYSGFGLHAGVSFPFLSDMIWKTEMRYNQLLGPNDSSASELDLYLGVGNEF